MHWGNVTVNEVGNRFCVLIEKGSHAIGSMMRNEAARKKILNMLLQEKKYPKECEEARRDRVRQIAEFLKEWK